MNWITNEIFNMDTYIFMYQNKTFNILLYCVSYNLQMMWTDFPALSFYNLHFQRIPNTKKICTFLNTENNKNNWMYISLANPMRMFKDLYIMELYMKIIGWCFIMIYWLYFVVNVLCYLRVTRRYNNLIKNWTNKYNLNWEICTIEVKNWYINNMITCSVEYV